MTFSRLGGRAKNLTFAMDSINIHHKLKRQSARLAQSVEHETLNLRVVGSSPTLGVIFFSRFYCAVKYSVLITSFIVYLGL